MVPRPWAFPARFDPEPTRTPGELALGLHRAVGELRRAARSQALRAGEGAVLLCELLPAAIEVVDDPVGTVSVSGIAPHKALPFVRVTGGAPSPSGADPTGRLSVSQDRIIDAGVAAARPVKRSPR